jgi:acyl-CoA thioester hydrolase
METTEQPLKYHAIRERVRWGDVDAAGIIFYGSYVRFFEFAESELFRVIGLPYSKLAEIHHVWLPRVHVEVDFRSPAKLEDLLEVRVAISKLGGSSIGLKFEAYRIHDPEGEGPVVSNVMVAEASYVLVCVDHVSFDKVAIPPTLRERLLPYTSSPVD